MIEKDLRAAFARHETDIPAVGPLTEKINRLAVRRKRRRAVTRTAGAAAAVLAAALAVPAALGGTVTPVASTAAPTTAPATVPKSSGPVNVLLVGRWKEVAEAVILVHLPADRKSVYLIDLPRDAKVPGPAGKPIPLGDTFHGKPYGGPKYTGAQLTTSTVERVTGVHIDATYSTHRQAMVMDAAIPYSWYPAGWVPGMVAKLRDDPASRDRENLRRAEWLMTSKFMENGDQTALRKVTDSLGDGAHAVGISERLQGRSTALLPTIGPGLFRALHDDTLDRWKATTAPEFIIE